ncbi:hypothetical protein EV702DRAFT_628138 [Suillus placidus]|uniref:Uncharacterized protein n=1 Tax=Suillus placidus TaxID=48579 RepID=A0A9P6ZM84_9AGAM|nr:hypothetical protein EV702DRAFT_628138 [Suillus placidus]
MVLPASPGARVPVSADLKTEPMAKAQKGFFSSLFSYPPKWSVIGRPRAPEALSHTPSEPLVPAHDLSRVQSAPQDLTPNLHQSKVSVVPNVPPFKSIKDNLHELGLTTPVVLTQPQVTGSETVLSQLDRPTSPRADMFFQRSLSCNTSRTSSESRHESSRGNALVASDHAINIELPILDITSANIQFAAPPPSAMGCPNSGWASQVDLVEKIIIPVSTAPDKAPPSVQGGSKTSNGEPPIPSSPSIASRSSTSQSKQSRIPSSTLPKRPRTAPGGSSELSRQNSVASGRQRHVTGEPVSLFPVDEGFFGRPKLPPPLKVIPKKVKKHQRTQTLAASPPSTTVTHERPVTRALSTRSHTTHQTPAWRAPASEPAGLFPIPNILTSDRSVIITRKSSVLSHSSRSAGPGPLPLPSDSELEIPQPSPSRAQAPKERSLSRINTQAIVASHQTQFSAPSAPELPPAKWTWTPPSSWSGPSSAVSSESGDSSHSSKKVTFSSMARLRRPKSSSRSVASVSKSLCSHPNTSSPTLAPSATTKSGKGRVPPLVQDKSDSTGVIVKMQGHEGDWEEAALQDVIPRLREMKSSALSD